LSRVLRIVVGESDPANREHLEQVLSDLGHLVAAASTGQHLVELARAAEPDLVITNATLPDTDGLRAAAAVNQEREVPVILVAGRHEARPPRPVPGNYVMACLTLPVRPPDLRGALAVALARFRLRLRARQEAADVRLGEAARNVLAAEDVFRGLEGC
jgi:CheY-like chemotaxis protein